MEEQIELLGEAYDIIQNLKEQPRPFHPDLEKEIQDLLDRINEELYKSI